MNLPLTAGRWPDAIGCTDFAANNFPEADTVGNSAVEVIKPSSQVLLLLPSLRPLGGTVVEVALRVKVFAAD